MQWNKQNLAWAEWAGPQVELLCNLVGWDSPPKAPDSSLSSSSLSTTASSYLSYWSLLLRKPLVNIIVMHWSLGLVVIIPFVMFTSLDPLMLSILNPILFDTESNTIQKMETEKFWNWNVSLCNAESALPLSCFPLLTPSAMGSGWGGEWGAALLKNYHADHKNYQDGHKSHHHYHDHNL